MTSQSIIEKYLSENNGDIGGCRDRDAIMRRRLRAMGSAIDEALYTGSPVAPSHAGVEFDQKLAQQTADYITDMCGDQTGTPRGKFVWSPKHPAA